MNIVSCLHPVRVPDPHVLGRYMYVPCGKCEVCKNRLSQDWVHRLQHESSCWQYTVFFTLTYDDYNLPFCNLVKIDDVYRLVESSTGQVFDYMPARKEIPYLRKLKRISYPNVRDHQLFLKRLRYYFNEYKKSEKNDTSKSIRYFTAFEYGPTTHRIHMHGLLFFNDRRGDFIRDIEKYISIAWKNGNVKAEIVNGSAAKYVAKYCDSPVSGKHMYSAPEFRVRHIQSKNPPIGSLLFSSTYIKNLFFSGAVQYRSILADKECNLPLPRYIVDRFYPKLPFNDGLSYSTLCSVYSIARWSGCSTSKDFVDFCFRLFQLPYVNIKHDSVFSYLFRLVNYNNRDCLSSLKRVYRISARVVAQADVFGISVPDYTSHIQSYLNNRNLTNLKTFYEFQQQHLIVKPSIPIQSYIFLDLDFIEYIENHVLADIPEWMLMTLDGYSIDAVRFCTDKSYRDSLNPLRHPLVQSYISKTKSLYVETSKIKAKKDYERSHGLQGLNYLYEKYF